jgi:RimJ/RimL family protein N-acetyltransferase
VDDRAGAAGAPYPRELERTAVLDDGTRVRIRPIRPDDEPRLADGYSRLSASSAYRRFFAARRQLPAEWFHYFANVDYRRRLALIAEHERRGETPLVGVARYEPTSEDDCAEVAFVIGDAWQGRGLGRVLLEAILAAAELHGIHRFQADVLADNRPMLALLAHHTDVEDRKTEVGVTTVRFRRRQWPAAAAGKVSR